MFSLYMIVDNIATARGNEKKASGVKLLSAGTGKF